MKITPVLVVGEIEPCLPFRVDRMGFRKVAEVPEGDRIGFVMLLHGGTELMLPSVASVCKDESAFAAGDASRVASLFIEVDDFADTVRRLTGT
jgi:hypothetical protein